MVRILGIRRYRIFSSSPKCCFCAPTTRASLKHVGVVLPDVADEPLFAFVALIVGHDSRVNVVRDLSSCCPLFHNNTRIKSVDPAIIESRKRLHTLQLVDKPHGTALIQAIQFKHETFSLSFRNSGQRCNFVNSIPRISLPMDKPDSPKRNVHIWTAHERLGWWILGLVLLAVLGLVVHQFLPWLIFGLFIYYVAKPITQRLERRIDSPTLVAVLTLLLIVIPIVVMLGAILLVALGQLVSTIADLPVDRILAQLPFPIADLPDTPSEVYDTTVVLVQDPSVLPLVGTVGQAIGTIGAVVFNMFLSLLIAFFLLVSDRNMTDWFESNVFGEDSLAIEYLSTVDRGLGSIYFGYTMTIFAVIILSAIIYTVFNFFAPGGLAIPSAVLLAVVTGFFTLVPLVGRSIVYFAIAAALVIQALTVDPRLLWFPLVFLAVMIIAFDNLVRTYIRPHLSGRLLNTGLVMFAYLFGPPLFGWYGIFFGPFLMVFIVTFVQMILPELATPEHERTGVRSEYTLDEFSENIAGRENEQPSEADDSNLGPEGDPTA